MRERQHIPCRHCGELLSGLIALRWQVSELEQANAELRVERDAADVLLGEAMDAVVKGRRS